MRRADAQRPRLLIQSLAARAEINPPQLHILSRFFFFFFFPKTSRRREKLSRSTQIFSRRAKLSPRRGLSVESKVRKKKRKKKVGICALTPVSPPLTDCTQDQPPQVTSMFDKLFVTDLQHIISNIFPRERERERGSVCVCVCV